MRRIPTYTGTGEVSIRALNNRPPDTLGISRELLAASAAKLWGWGRNAWKIFETLASFLASLPLSFHLPRPVPHPSAGCSFPIHLPSRPVLILLVLPAMQRALSSRASVLSAAAKRAPFARSPLNLQQQRFAHKVRHNHMVIAARVKRSMAAGHVFRRIRSVLVANPGCL